MRWAFLRKLNFLADHYRTATNVAGTVLVAWILSAIAGQMISLFIPENTSASVPDYDSTLMPSATAEFGATNTVDFFMPICDRNIFDSQKRSACSIEPQDAEPQEPEINMTSEPIKSDIAATLLGTMVSTKPERSFATITPKSGKETKNYRICPEGNSDCELILDEGRIYEIVRNKVFFVRNGHREFLEVENLPSIYLAPPTSPEAPAGGPGGVKLMGDKAIVSRAKIEATLGDLNKVIQDARMVPNYENGVANGFKIFAIKPNSIFSELGIQNGDVIQRINGTEINSIEKALPMLQLARTESSISIDLTRRGAKKTLMIDVQ